MCLENKAVSNCNSIETTTIRICWRLNPSVVVVKEIAVPVYGPACTVPTTGVGFAQSAIIAKITEGIRERQSNFVCIPYSSVYILYEKSP